MSDRQLVLRTAFVFLAFALGLGFFAYRWVVPAVACILFAIILSLLTAARLGKKDS